MTESIPQPKAWGRFKAVARKLAPSRAVRWTAIYVPLFVAALLFALQVASKGTAAFADLNAYVLEAGTRSVPVLIGIAITYGVASGMGWNLDNGDRAKYQALLAGHSAHREQRFGAFLVLAGEMVSVLALLWLMLRAMLAWQGQGG